MLQPLPSCENTGSVLLTPMEPDIQILNELLAANGGFVPGNRLTDILGVSRVAVWGRLERLKEQGIEIEAQRQHGYRLVAEPPYLHEALLRAYARRLGVGTDLYFHSTIDSTNSEAERLLAAGMEDPCVVVAGEQTAGRGRMGRQWHSPHQGNLYVSFAFRPRLIPRDMPVVTLWFGLAVARCLQDEFELPVLLKWPNDLHLNGRKVAGMLTEARIDADQTRDLVFGLGMNIAAEMEAWPETVRQRATTLNSHHPVSVNAVSMSVIKAVLGSFARFVAGDREALAKDWPRFDALAMRTVEAEYNGKRIRGTAQGIHPDGSLRLQTEDGAILSLHSGEVTIGRLQTEVAQ